MVEGWAETPDPALRSGVCSSFASNRFLGLPFICRPRVHRMCQLFGNQLVYVKYCFMSLGILFTDSTKEMGKAVCFMTGCLFYTLIVSVE